MNRSTSTKSRRLAAAKGTACLKVGDAAAELNVSQQHVLNLIEEGKLAAIDVGTGSHKHYRVPREWLDTYKKTSCNCVTTLRSKTRQGNLQSLPPLHGSKQGCNALQCARQPQTAARPNPEFKE